MNTPGKKTGDQSVVGDAWGRLTHCATMVGLDILIALGDQHGTFAFQNAAVDSTMLCRLWSEVWCCTKVQ